MPLSGASPARGAGALKGGCYTVGFVFTLSSGAVTMTYGQQGFTVGTFTNGEATLSFPKHFKFLSGFGNANTYVSNTAGSVHDLRVSQVDLAAGTAKLSFNALDNGDDEDPGNETCYLTLVVGE